MFLSKSLTLLISLLLSLSLSTIVSASGSYGGSRSASNSSSSSSSSSRSNSGRVDEIYEYGKSLYQGRNKKYGKVQYCVTSNGGTEINSISKSSLKPYKRKLKQNLVKNLYKCDIPEQKISSVLNKNDMNVLVYYFNKRYDLKLVN